MAVLASLSIAACSGGAGTGTGLPAPPGYNPTPNAAAAQTIQEHTTAGAIYLTKDVDELKFPASTGFGFTIDLGATAPTPVPSGFHAKPTAAPSPSPSASPAPRTTDTPAPKGKRSKPTPDPTPSGPKIDTKVTVFPMDAPAAPTPEATGAVRSFAQRVPVVRTYLLSATTLKLYSLAAVHFKLPKDERPEGRGFTIAVFEQHKHRKYGLVAWEPEATVEGDTVSVSDATEPLTLKKKMGYVFVLYGDDLEPTPVPHNYAPPGQNPFVTPTPAGRPGFPQQYGPPTPYGGQQPYGAPTPRQ
jgi:hypothetical protein